MWMSKSISGDDPRTVAAIAAKAGVRGKAVDMTTVKDIDQAVQIIPSWSSNSGTEKQMVLALKDKAIPLR